MKNNFWQKLKHPFFVMAPMADVTDFVFRQMFAKYGAPDVYYTEFVSADGLASKEGRKALIRNLRLSKDEHPIVAQIFGANPENIKIAAKLVCELGYDGLDINMGCPDKSVIKQGAGSGLIKNPVLAREIIRVAKEGAGEMPVSVKTRIGFNKEEIETWIPEILAEKPACLIIHGRTRKELSAVDADWDAISRVAEMGKAAGVLVVGNGDVQSLEDGMEKAEKFGVDGVMVGRGIFGQPWFFNRDRKEIPLEKRLKIMLEHTELFEKEMVGVKGFHVMKKHFKAYIGGFDGAKELRAKLMESNNFKEISDIVEDFLRQYEKK